MKGYTIVIPLFGRDDPDHKFTRAALGIGLRALVAQNLLWLMTHPRTPPLYRADVWYEREPPGREEWQTIPATLARGSGDCEDLASWRVAELQARGEPARIITKTAHLMMGGKLVHVLVKRGDGTIEDPSAILGMGTER